MDNTLSSLSTALGSTTTNPNMSSLALAWYVYLVDLVWYGLFEVVFIFHRTNPFRSGKGQVRVWLKTCGYTAISALATAETGLSLAIFSRLHGFLN